MSAEDHHRGRRMPNLNRWDGDNGQGRWRLFGHLAEPVVKR